MSGAADLPRVRYERLLMLLSRRPHYYQKASHMFERCQHILAMSVLGAITAIGCTPVLVQSQGRRPGLVAISAKTDSAFSRCAQSTNPIDTVTPASEPFGVVDPQNQNHLVISWMQRARFGVTVLRSAASFDGGESWPYVTTLPLTSCATRTTFSFHTAGDPWLAVGGNGLIYASGLSFTDDSARDRKSTRLNSSHSQISYAVFCLKKKKKKQEK